jgi:hypothetical protein
MTFLRLVFTTEEDRFLCAVLSKASKTVIYLIITEECNHFVCRLSLFTMSRPLRDIAYDRFHVCR